MYFVESISPDPGASHPAAWSRCLRATLPSVTSDRPGSEPGTPPGIQNGSLPGDAPVDVPVDQIERAAVEDRTAAMTALEREISMLFRSARSMSERIATHIHPDLDAPGYALLVTILELDADGQGVRAVDVANRTKLHKSTLSRSIADLERLGLVARVRDPQDARARLVTLTERGRTAVEKSRLGRSELMLDRLAGWDTNDLAQLATLLRRFSRALSPEI